MEIANAEQVGINGISRMDQIIERLSQMDKYSRETELRIEEVIQKLGGSVPGNTDDAIKNPTRDGKLGDIEGLISETFINLEGIASVVSRLEELI